MSLKIIREAMKEAWVSKDIPISDTPDINTQRQDQLAAKEEKLLYHRSQSVQKNLPRPSEINLTLLRQPHEVINEIMTVNAEELIKKEMLCILCHDAVVHTATNQVSAKRHHIALAKKYIYEPIPEVDIAGARQIIVDEVENIKNSAGYSHLSFKAYCAIWDECYKEVLYIPSQARVTRASISHKKERLEFYQKRLESNRHQMAIVVKKANKLEKILKRLFSSYQLHAAGIRKQLDEVNNQIQQTTYEYKTFKELRLQEVKAMERRKKPMQENISYQIEREKKLKKRYSHLLSQVKLCRLK